MIRAMGAGLAGTLVIGGIALTAFLLAPVETSTGRLAPLDSLVAIPSPDPGCRSPAEIVHPFTGHPEAERRDEAGEVVDAVVIRARFPCAPIDGPAVAFNWYTLRGFSGRIADLRYKVYAAPLVYRDAGAQATVTMLSGPQVVARRDGPAMAVGDVPLPLVHDTMTMPFYPNPDATVRMIEANVAEYFAMLRVKRRAIGEDGYFGWQECLYDCAALRAPRPLPANASRWARIQALRDTKIPPPILVLHVAMPPDDVPAHAARLAAAFGDTTSDVVLRYVGRTIADSWVRTRERGDVPGLQKNHWVVASVALQLSDRVTPEAALALPEVAALLGDGTRHAALYFAR
jgi:hypothetical protein